MDGATMGHGGAGPDSATDGPPPRGTLGPLGSVLVTVGRALSAVPRLVAWVLPVAWAGSIFLLSSQELDLGAFGLTAGGAFLGNLGHPFAFGILALLVIVALSPRVATKAGPWAAPSAALALWCAVLATLYGFTDELHQSTVDGRDASLLDLSSDFVGAAFAAWTVRALQTRRTTRRRLGLILLGGIVCSLAAAGLSTWWGLNHGSGPWPF